MFKKITLLLPLLLGACKDDAAIAIAADGHTFILASGVFAIKFTGVKEILSTTSKATGTIKLTAATPGDGDYGCGVGITTATVVAGGASELTTTLRTATITASEIKALDVNGEVTATTCVIATHMGTGAITISLPAGAFGTATVTSPAATAIATVTT